ncbi:MAG TPA: response regulator transcription factor [Trueperaceae bacterium]|nr:response regulator transcription factor [Trueperaceae bacterium]
MRRLWPDAVVLAERAGSELAGTALRAIRSFSDAPVLVLASGGGAATELRFFRLGADDVVWLPASPRVVAARVATLVRRASAPPECPVWRLGLLAIDRYRNGVSVRGQEVVVTPAEYRLLVVLAGAPGRVFSRAELIEGAAPESDALERTVDVHVCSLRRKLARAGAFGVLQTVRGAGYRLSDAVIRA